jgi:transcriptional regulator with XRE-family HTH domain
LARLRSEAGLSLYELSQRSGINRSNLHRLENGVITDPSRETLNRIARALSAEPEELYDVVAAADPSALPSLPTYFRSKYGLGDEEIAEVQRIVEATGKKPRTAKMPGRRPPSGSGSSSKKAT